MLTNVPGIRVHTSIEAMLWALEEFFLSMLGVNIAVGDQVAYPAAFPQRLLIIDEFGTFASMAGRMWRREHGTGPSPALDQRRQIEWQGRQAGHRLVLAAHQPNVRLFGDSDSRAQYGYRLRTGAYSTSLWRDRTPHRHPAAARFLGYGKPESFRRVRTRHPIPGEQRLADGRPYWSPAALRNWHASRKIAGNRDRPHDRS